VSASPFRPRISVVSPMSVRVTRERREQAMVAMSIASADTRLVGIASSIPVIPDFPKLGGRHPDFHTQSLLF
jgi:adenine phosphoribosyltransferase